MSDSLISGVAHLDGVGGTFVAPARSPYERQLLRENAARMVGRGVELTLAVGGKQWIIRKCIVSNSSCATCTQSLGRLSCTRVDEMSPSCIECALHAGRNELN